MFFANTLSAMKPMRQVSCKVKQVSTSTRPQKIITRVGWTPFERAEVRELTAVIEVLRHPKRSMAHPLRVRPMISPTLPPFESPACQAVHGDGEDQYEKLAPRSARVMGTHPF